MFILFLYKRGFCSINKIEHEVTTMIWNQWWVSTSDLNLKLYGMIIRDGPIAQVNNAPMRVNEGKDKLLCIYNSTCRHYTSKLGYKSLKKND